MKHHSPSGLARFSWVLYDFANTIYSMNVVTMYFSLWITVNLARGDLWVSFSNSFSMALVAVSLPILGTYSDFSGKKLPFLWWFTLASVLGTIFIGISGNILPQNTLQIMVAVLFFIIANYAYQGGLVFYNALLPLIASPQKIGKVSGYGVGMGYLGSITGLLMVMPFVQGEISFLNLKFPGFQKQWHTVTELTLPQTTGSLSYLDTTVTANDHYQYRLGTLSGAGISDRQGKGISSKDTVIIRGQRTRRVIQVHIHPSDREHTHLLLQRRVSGWGRIGSFIPTGILFFLFALPIFLFVREPERGGPGAPKPALGTVFRDVWEGLSNTRKYPGVLRFLIAKYFYEEGIQTAIIFMAVYAVKVMGFSNEVIIPFFMIATTAAAIGSTIFGFVTDWLGAKQTLLLVIGGWLLSLVGIVVVQQKFWFWILGSVIGMLMGSTWTAARPLMVSLVPGEKLAEFFGFYALSGKAAAIFGPLVWGVVVTVLAPYGDAIRYRGAVLSLALLMGIGFALLWKVPAKSIQNPAEISGND